MHRLLAFPLLIIFYTPLSVVTAFNEDLLQNLLEVGLPVLQIETVNHDFPTCEELYAPEGCWGQSIINATKVPGRIVLTSPDGEILYDSGDYEEDVSGMTIKIRGNTSASYPKKPYKIKLQKKADLLCRGEKRFKDKEWLLLQDVKMNNFVGFKVSELIGLEYTPSYQYVNVIFNDEYYGVYMLCESVKRKAESRVIADADYGFIVELDAYWWKEETFIYSSFNEPVNYTFKYPDVEDVTPEKLNDFTSYLQQMEESLSNDTYASYINVTSFATWLLAQEMLGNNDGGGSNIYLRRYADASCTLTMPVLWDFDHIKEAIGWAPIHHLHIFRKLFAQPDGVFLQEFLRQWDLLKDIVYDGLIDELNTFCETAEGEALNRSMELDDERWKYEYMEHMSLRERSYQAIYYFADRKSWLEGAMQQAQASMAANPVVNTRASQTPTTLPISTIDGKMMNPWHRYDKTTLPYNILIIDGKKYMQR